MFFEVKRSSFVEQPNKVLPLVAVVKGVRVEDPQQHRKFALLRVQTYKQMSFISISV